MRLLVTIPHFCRRGPGDPPAYGSESGDVDARLSQVGRCLAALHQTFGPRQALAATKPSPANTTLGAAVDVVLVTSHDQHVADALPRHLFAQVATDVEPRNLGFACHAVMREHAGRYDCYAYLEDDIEVADPLFFAKLGWFSRQFGHSALLQPNRFELAPDLETMKLYVDGDTAALGLPARYQDIATRPRLVADAFGRSFLFERVNNVHSGCFFLNAPQLARVAASPQFGKPTAEFFGPLESAATLMIMRAFEVYKPARENAGFLEVQHLGRRFLTPRQDQPAPPARPDEADDAPVPALTHAHVHADVPA